MKPTEAKADQAVTRRRPRQARSLYKVQLILDSALEILERGDVADLNTNTIAEKAGVSVGTVYQYFDDKAAIVDALVARELEDMTAGIMRTMRDSKIQRPGDRIRALVSGVAGSYRGRARAHRQLIVHSLSRGRARLSPMLSAMQSMLSGGGVASPSGEARVLDAADAFVLTHAVAGVLRALASEEHAPARDAVAESLVRLTVGFYAQAAAR